MINPKLFFLIAFAFLTSAAFAQTSITSGDKTFEIGGVIAGYVNYRFPNPGYNSYKKDEFAFRNLRLWIQGRTKTRWHYELQVDVLPLVSGGSTAENPALVTAEVDYSAKLFKNLPSLNIKLGYDKLPYSMSVQESIFSTAFWQRATFCKGDYFSQRDLGLTLHTNFWKQKINIYGGAYSGLGEAIFTANGGDTDPSGHLEYVGRIDVATSSRYRYEEVDYRQTPFPNLRFGINARYANKTQPAGQSLPAPVAGVPLQGPYGISVVNGKKLIYGGDISFSYRGFSAQFETDIIVIHPADSADPLYYGTSREVNKGVVKAGGFFVQANYFLKPAKSVFSTRFDYQNPNNLAYGYEKWINFAYAYQINGWRSTLKIQYYRPLHQDATQNPLNYTGQIRMGWQYEF